MIFGITVVAAVAAVITADRIFTWKVRKTMASQDCLI
jgi:hypothetical protein